eukprot:CAMPEP_0168357598 /NCGR_PEP_ID=MMETSP0228-20121227/675_1 /TAXON_ID=133427 /ORGANISM="Protoceratium reticulatum, Strain CCCM 535 (=CCMP 1889)" /LENGTH=121 /DNA_ID=CAMNT_0008370133 /DNA_START=212 /DNA_END=574 /DNA_ORIENTATION=+
MGACMPGTRPRVPPVWHSEIVASESGVRLGPQRTPPHFRASTGPESSPGASGRRGSARYAEAAASPNEASRAAAATAAWALRKCLRTKSGPRNCLPHSVHWKRPSQILRMCPRSSAAWPGP